MMRIPPGFDDSKGVWNRTHYVCATKSIETIGLIEDRRTATRREKSGLSINNNIDRPHGQARTTAKIGRRHIVIAT